MVLCPSSERLNMGLNLAPTTISLKRRKRRDMPLCETRSRNDRQGHFAESLQQAFSRGLSRPTFAIASKQASQFLFLHAQALTYHAFQHGQNAQGEGEQANAASVVARAPSSAQCIFWKRSESRSAPPYQGSCWSYRTRCRRAAVATDSASCFATSDVDRPCRSSLR